jgi:phosphohistidine phosphatase
MRIYLVRHAEAKSEDQHPERPLSEQGNANANKVAAFLRPLRLSVDAVWHSGKARAQQTAEILASALATREGCVAQEGLAPNDPVEPIQSQLAEAGRDVMIVGHLPFLGKLASLFVAGDASRESVVFPNVGALCLERAESGHWSVVWMIVPSLLNR